MTECEICMREPDPDLPNGNHKMSCPNGERWQNKVTAPVQMLGKYPPPSPSD